MLIWLRLAQAKVRLQQTNGLVHEKVIAAATKATTQASVKAPASRRGIIRSTLCPRRIGSLRSKFVSFYQSS